MKTSRNDLFDLQLCIRGLGTQLTRMHSDLYEYAYYLTFKHSMKAYKDEFTDPWEKHIREHEFFLGSTDPFVRQSASAIKKIIYFKFDLCLRHGIDEVSDLHNPEIIAEAYRYQPYYLCFKESKTYEKMNLFVMRTLMGIIESLYLYACTITAQSYKIPQALRRQFKFPETTSLWLLNEDNNDVYLLINLITGLKEDLSEYKLLIENKGT